MARAVFLEADQFFRVRIRQRSKQDRIDYAEDRCIGADAEREGDNRNGSKRRLLEKLS